MSPVAQLCGNQMCTVKNNIRPTSALECVNVSLLLRVARDWPKHVGGYCVVKWHLLDLCRISVVSIMYFITSPNILTLSAQARGNSSLV